MNKRNLSTLIAVFCLTAVSCSQGHKNVELDPSRACAPELAPDGNRAEALERLLNGNRSGNACYAS